MAVGSAAVPAHLVDEAPVDVSLPASGEGLVSQRSHPAGDLAVHRVRREREPACRLHERSKSLSQTRASGVGGLVPVIHFERTATDRVLPRERFHRLSACAGVVPRALGMLL